MAPSTTTRVTIAGACALALAMGIGRFAFTPSLPALERALGFGDDTAGLVAAVNFLGYLVGAPAAGLIARPASQRRALLAGLALSLATSAALALAPPVPVLAVLRLASGVASGVIFVMSAAIVMQTLAAIPGARPMGTHFAGVGLGIALSGVVCWLVPAAIGWGSHWLALGLIGLVLAVPGWLWLRPPARALASHVPAAKAAAGGRLETRVVLLAIAYLLQGLGYVVTATFIVASEHSTQHHKVCVCTKRFSNVTW